MPLVSPIVLSLFLFSLSPHVTSCSRLLPPFGAGGFEMWGRRTARNLVLGGVLDDGDDTLKLLGCVNSVSIFV